MSATQFSLACERYFIPAELQHHPNSNGWLIVFYVLHPVTQEMAVVRIKCNRLRKKCKTMSEFRQLTGRMILDLNVKLAGGWNPFTLGKQSSRSMEELGAVIDKFLLDRQSLVREDTYRSYHGVLSLFRQWLDKVLTGCRCMDFNRLHATMYMEHRLEKKISAYTYNGNLKILNVFFEWCKTKCYVTENPFAGIDERSEEEKEREVIPLDDLTRIRTYFEERCPGYVLVMLLVFFSGLRPTEVTRIKVKQVCLAYKHIKMPGRQTKNKEPRCSPLSEEEVNFLSSYLWGAKPDDYLVGLQYKPGAKPCTTKSMQRRWRNMREELGLPETYQLYSLRDSIAYYRMESTKVAPLDAMKGMGHKHLSQTLGYANHEVLDLANRLEKGSPMF